MDDSCIKLVQRHYVASQADVLELERIAERTLRAKASRNDWHLGILVNHHSETVHAREILKIGERMIENGIDYSVKRGHGAGAAGFDAQFSTLGTTSVSQRAPINFLIDGDQYDVSDLRVISGISHLADSLVERNLLWGVSSRTQILLSDNDELNALRQIEEMFHVHAMGDINIENPNGLDISKVPLPFRKYGDPVPGLYALNTAHHKFTELQSSAFAACRAANLTRYAGDPYVMMKASTLSKGLGVVMPVPQNPPSPFGKETLTLKSRELAKTDIGRMYLNAVNSARQIHELEAHYGSERVATTRKLILSGIHETLAQVARENSRPAKKIAQ